jgi:hypothetical protein
VTRLWEAGHGILNFCILLYHPPPGIAGIIITTTIITTIADTLVMIVYKLLFDMRVSVAAIYSR